MSNPNCQGHMNQKLWRDQSAVNGMIRTVCSVCGKFIGNRPVARAEAVKEAKGKRK